MRCLKTVMKKELADHFSSYRFTIIFALIAMISVITAYMIGLNIKKELEGVAKPQFIFMMLFTSSGLFFSLVQFVAFFGPLVGLVLGFDAVNRERNEGTLSKLLSQPVYRDTVINGKFLAGVVMIAIMMASIVLVITGLGLIVLGIVPGLEELLRIFIYLVISIVYISLWLGVAILFSLLFRSPATSALATLAIWIFFSFFVPIGANLLASAVVPGNKAADPDDILLHANIQQSISLTSPMKLYSDSVAVIINPMRNTTQTVMAVGPMEKYSLTRFAGPLPLSQSVLIAAPYLILLVALTVVCFAIMYTVFLRQEIRSL